MWIVLACMICTSVVAQTETTTETRSRAETMAIIDEIEFQRLEPRALGPHIDDRDPIVRARVARTLGRLGSSGSLPPLRMLLTDPNPEVRAEAAFAIGLIGEGDRSLMNRLRDEEDPTVRMRIVEAIGRNCQTRNCVEVAVWALSEEPNRFAPSPIRDAATIAIGRMAHRNVESARSPAIVSSLIGQLSQSNVRTRRASAFALESMHLSELPNAMARQLFEEVTGESDPQTLASLLSVVSMLDDQAVAQARILRHFVDHYDPSIRSSVARAARNCQWRGVTVLLEDVDPATRRVTMNAVVEIEDLDHSALLLPFLDAVRASPERANAVDAATALAALSRTDTPAPPEPWTEEVWPSILRDTASNLLSSAPAQPRETFSEANEPAETSLLVGPDSRGILSARIRTDRGEFVIDLYPEAAPLTVSRFVTRAEAGHYDGLAFNRVDPDFCAETESATMNDTTGLPIEIGSLTHEFGTVSMGRNDDHTSSDAWFITLSNQPLFDTEYTLFGRVVSGQQYLRLIEPGDQISDIEIEWRPSMAP